MRFSMLIPSLIYGIILLGHSPVLAQNPEDSVKIEKIEISRNWMTWDRVIKNELLFGEGPEGTVIRIEALDALQIYPVMSIDHSSENDYHYRLGVGDENFLGSNSELKNV
jgi:hypothetical protein